MNKQETELTPKKKWYYSIGFVVTLLIVVGPLGLPLLYASTEFSKRSKVIITILVIAVTLYATFQTVLIVQMFIEHYRQAFGIVF